MATSQGTTTNRNLGRLLRTRTAHRYPGAVVYAFPLGESDEELLAKMVTPMPEFSGAETAEEKKERYASYGEEYFDRLEEKCAAVWPEERIMTTVCQSTKRGGVVALALVACTSPNDEFIPKGDVMQSLIDILKNEGFTAKPRWLYPKF